MRWCNSTCSISSTQEKTNVSHGFFFRFMGQNLREIPKRHEIDSNQFRSIVPGIKNERNFVPHQEIALCFSCRHLKYDFLRKNSYFQSKNTHVKTKKIIFKCTFLLIHRLFLFPCFLNQEVGSNQSKSIE